MTAAQPPLRCADPAARPNTGTSTVSNEAEVKRGFRTPEISYCAGLPFTLASRMTLAGHWCTWPPIVAGSELVVDGATRRSEDLCRTWRADCNR